MVSPGAPPDPVEPALVELEGQAQKMQLFVQAAKAMGIPLSNQIQALKQYARGLKLDPDLMLPTDDEIAKMKEQESKNPPVNIDQKKVEVAQENNRLDAQTAKDLMAYRAQDLSDRKEERASRERMGMAEIASREGTTLQAARQKYGFEAQKTQAVLADKAAERAHDAQKTNAQMQFHAQTGEAVQ